MYHVLKTAFGPQRWWPARSVWEIAVGAVLTQNTSWRQAERAIARLDAAGLPAPHRLLDADDDALYEAVHPAGYFRQKSARLRWIAAEVERHGSLAAWLDAGGRLPDDALRRRFLAIPGIGPETADCLLVYTAGRPAFVADAYARRIGTRLGWFEGAVDYETARAAVMAAWRATAAEWAEFHALLVELSKRHCRARPACGGCPLRRECAYETARA